ncbi:PCP reductase family protein [Synechococcus sp. PCC 7336]|uniref:PCP reductase family protein n=1 Tax=Synechococcus sp. PCC 7336 TaxID=195250 RepID=UPI00034B47F4|nr:PCP reductase family protein [Synechococcus sp. PCC 7336]
MSEFDDLLEWTDEAQEKFRKIPFFVRTQARQRIEALARKRDVDIVTAELVEEARQESGQ